ncbi:MAG: peptidyl-prolyl cis-trans isomerase, partial [Psychroflexus sp.]
MSVLVLTLQSCQFFQSEDDREVVASVNKHKLFKEQLITNIPEKLTGNDSLSYVKSYIEKWANDKLIMDKAELNLPKSIKNEFDSLSKKYKQEL